MTNQEILDLSLILIAMLCLWVTLREEWELKKQNSVSYYFIYLYVL